MSNSATDWTRSRRGNHSGRQAMSADNLTWIWSQRAPLITSTAQHVLLALNEFTRPAVHQDWRAFPSQQTLCEYTSLRERAVRNALRQLERAGLIRVEAAWDDSGRQTRNTYWLLSPVPMQIGAAPDAAPPAPDAAPPAEDAGTGRHQMPVGTRHDVPPIPVIEKPPDRRAKKERFAPPSREDVAKYMLDINSQSSPDQFIDHYTSCGWRVGKNPMKDWRATVRNWKRTDDARSIGPNQPLAILAAGNGARSTRHRTLEEDLNDRSWAD